MRKYSHLDLPRYVEITEGPFRTSVNELKEKTGRKRAPELVEMYRKYRVLMDEIKEKKSALEIVLTAYSELLVLAYEEEGITSLKLQDGSSIRVDVEPEPVANDREAFRNWCIEEGLEKEMHLHYMTSKSLIKLMLLEGKPLPPGMQAFMRDKIVFTKGK